MITLIHGDDLITSRDYLNTLFQTHTENGSQVVKFDTNITLEKLTLALLPSSLFGETQIVFIENLWSLKSAKLVREVLQKLTSETSKEVILFQDRSLGKLELQKLPQAIVREYPLKTEIFALLDSLGQPPSRLLSTLSTTLRNEPPEKILASLATRISLLVQAQRAPDTLTIQGYYRTKILSQLRQLGPDKLESIADRLIAIDLDQKTGRNPYELETALYLSLATP